MQEKAKSSSIAIKIVKQLFDSMRGRLHYLKGFPPFLYITLNLIMWIAPLIIIVILKFLFPFGKVKAFSHRVTSWMYAFATWIDDFLLWKLLGISLEIRGLEGLKRDQWCLVLANHQSWADILVLQTALNRKIPALRFLVKRELIYVPIVGQICWGLDYPFLKRHSRAYLQRHPESRGEDLKTLKQSLERSIDYPASLVNLTEGTRFSLEKAKRQQSPYRYLLKPRTGGFKITVQALGPRLKDIIDVTIVYDHLEMSFWGFLSGNCRQVVVKVEKIPMNNVLQFMNQGGAEKGSDPYASWLQALWKKKDENISYLRDYIEKRA
jgi:1-acyl-sn-glycerol-3-phosphate acyltransferase